jgi:hypothetical protein
VTRMEQNVTSMYGFSGKPRKDILSVAVRKILNQTSKKWDGMGVKWFRLFQNKYQSRAAVNTVVYLRVL